MKMIWFVLFFFLGIGIYFSINQTKKMSIEKDYVSPSEGLNIYNNQTHLFLDVRTKDENSDNPFGIVIERVENTQTLDEEEIESSAEESLPKDENFDDPLSIVIEPFDETEDLDKEETESQKNVMNIDVYSNLEP